MRGRRHLALVALLGLAAGCGESGPPRLAVSGTVTLDGKPLPSGTITFAPLEGLKAATTEIHDGTFTLSSSDGPAAGRYQVEIRALEPTGKRIPDPDQPKETIEEVRNLIPSQYNTRTTLSAEVKADAENTFKYDLSSKAPGTPARRGR